MVSLITGAALVLVSLMCADASPRGQSPAMYSASGRVIDAITAQAIAGAPMMGFAQNRRRPATLSFLCGPLRISATSALKVSVHATVEWQKPN